MVRGWKKAKAAGWVVGMRTPSSDVASSKREARVGWGGGRRKHRKSQVAWVREATERTEARGNGGIGGGRRWGGLKMFVARINESMR